MVVPEIRCIEHLLPSAEDLNHYHPSSSEFAIPLDISIGEKNKPGEDVFHLTVASPEALRSASAHEPKWGRGYLIVSEFNYAAVVKAIKKYCDACTGETWEEVAQKLNRAMKWEFDGYKPSRPVKNPDR